eukprot:610362-Prymnesium_polylepis.1
MQQSIGIIARHLVRPAHRYAWRASTGISLIKASFKGQVQCFFCARITAVSMQAILDCSEGRGPPHPHAA